MPYAKKGSANADPLGKATDLKIEGVVLFVMGCFPIF
jgi:hypothetical protein